MTAHQTVDVCILSTAFLLVRQLMHIISPAQPLKLYFAYALVPMQTLLMRAFKLPISFCRWIVADQRMYCIQTFTVASCPPVNIPSFHQHCCYSISSTITMCSGYNVFHFMPFELVQGSISTSNN